MKSREFSPRESAWTAYVMSRTSLQTSSSPASARSSARHRDTETVDACFGLLVLMHQSENRLAMQLLDDPMTLG